jgi:hypothetical protein
MMTLLASLMISFAATDAPPPAVRWTLETVVVSFFATDHPTLRITSDGHYEFGPIPPNEHCRPTKGTVADLPAFDGAVRSAWPERWAPRYANKNVLDGYVVTIRLVGYDRLGNVVVTKAATVENPELPGAELRPPVLRSLEVLSAPYAVCAR